MSPWVAVVWLGGAWGRGIGEGEIGGYGMGEGARGSLVGVAVRVVIVASCGWGG